MRILPLGDSITWGCCIREEGSYRAMLYQMLAAAGYNVDFVGNQTLNSNSPLLGDPDHEGHNGYQIHEIDAGIEGWLSTIDEPDVILLLIGTNDYGHQNDITHAKDRLESLIAHIATLRPYAHIIVGNLLLRTDNATYDQQIQDTFNPYVPGIVSHQVSLGRRVSFVDTRTGIGPEDLDDGLHPNAAGYDKLAARWFPALTSVLTPLGTAYPPGLVKAKGWVDLKHLSVTFSKPVDDSAVELTHFALSGGLTVLSAELDEETKRTVTLTTTPQSANTVYTLTVNGVRDRTPEAHTIAAGSALNFQSGPVVEAAGYELVYSLRVGKQVDYNASGVPYELDRHGEGGRFSRVAYYLELKPFGSGSAQYVWVSMDAFTGDKSKIGVPSLGSGAFFQGPVANLHVQSSVAGIVSGTGLTGNLEFWPGDYGPGNTAGVPGASDTAYDRGDTAVAGEAGYGSMQVHNSAAGQTLFALNGWGGVGSDVDVGIGNAPGPNTDWTLAQNAGNYTSRLLQVLVLEQTGTPSAPVITREPGNQTVPIGGSVTFEVAAVGDEPLSYQWQRNGADLPGATSSQYTLNNVQMGDQGSYRAVVRNGSGSATSAAGVLRVVEAGVLVNGSFENGTQGWMALGHQAVGSTPGYATTDGSKLLVFNWGQTTPDGVVLQNLATTVGQVYVLRFDVGAAGLNQNEQRLRVTVEGQGSLAAEEFSLFGIGGGKTGWQRKSYGFKANSSTTTVTFRDLSPTTTDMDLVLDNVRVDAEPRPVIVSQPEGATVQVGQGLSLRVGALGAAGQGPLTYQWRREGVDIEGATGSQYTLASAAAEDSGSYAVVVSNGAGSVSSTMAVVAVGQPGGLLNGSFEPDTRGWNRSGNVTISWIGSGRRPVDGEHMAVYNSGDSTPNGVLSQRVATVPGQAYGLDFHVGVFAFTKYEQRMRVGVVGNSPLLSQTISLFGMGNGQTLWVPKSYTFVADSVATTVSFQDISPATAALDLELDRVRIYPTVTRTLTVTSSSPNSGASVSVNPPDRAGASDGITGFTRTFLDGTLVNLTAAATAGGNAFQKWQKAGVDFSTSPITSILMDQDHGLTAVYFPGPPVITVQPASTTVAVGATATFNVTATGQEPLSYQWRFNGSPIPGATASSYVINNTQTTAAGNYDVVVSNPAGPTTSSAAVLTVVQAGTFVNGSFESDFAGWTASGNCAIRDGTATDGVKSVAFNQGQTTPNAVISQVLGTTAGQVYTLSFDQGVLAYNTSEQRLRVTVQGNGTLLSQTVSIFGVGKGTLKWASRSFTFTADSPVATLMFQDVSPTSNSLDMFMDNVRLTVQAPAPPVITTQPASTTVAVGGTATFNVSATGQGSLSYQWRINGTPIPGATASSYTISNVQTTDGGNYDVIVSSAAGPTTSSAAVLTVVQGGSFVNGSFESDFAGWNTSGNCGIRTGSATDGVKAVVFNTGQTTPNAVVSQVISTTTGQVYTLSFDQGVLAYNTLEQRLRVTVQGSGTLLSQTVSVFGVGNGTVKWAARSFTFTADSGAATLTFQDVSPTSNSLDMLLDNVRLTVQASAPPVITKQPASTTVAVGGTATFSVTATGQGPLSYQWRFNTSPITGATASSYTINNVQASHAGTYDVVVSNATGPTTSSAAVLTVVQGGTFVNGSFESDFAGWTTSGNCAIREGTATDGVKAAAFNQGQTTPNAVLSQVISTTAGQVYTLSFDQGVLAYNTLEQRLRVTVQGSGALLSQTVSIFGVGNGTVKWAARSFTFTADSGAATLTFQDVSPTSNSIDMLLDNVRLTPQGGATLASLAAIAPGEITEDLGNVASLALSIARVGQGWRIAASTVEDGIYKLERSRDLQSWIEIGEAQRPKDGLLEFEDSDPSDAFSFYRIMPADRPNQVGRVAPRAPGY